MPTFRSPSAVARRSIWPDRPAGPPCEVPAGLSGERNRGTVELAKGHVIPAATWKGDHMSDSVPPGWYNDVQRPGGMRYWDGAAWTEHVTDPPVAPVPPPSVPQAAPALPQAPTALSASINPAPSQQAIAVSRAELVAAGHRSTALVVPIPLKRRNVVAVWLGLPLITLGFYHWYWWPRINTELAAVDPSIKVNGFGVWAAMVPGSFLVVPPFVSVYNTGKRISAAQHAAGTGASCNPVLGLILLFVFYLTPLYYQSELNKISDHGA
jgi:hypothetical protein